MRMSKIATSAVMALSLVAVPTLASAAPAASNMAVSARVGAPVAKANKAAGGSGLIIALLAGAAVIAGIIIAANNGKAVSR